MVTNDYKMMIVLETMRTVVSVVAITQTVVMMIVFPDHPVLNIPTLLPSTCCLCIGSCYAVRGVSRGCSEGWGEGCEQGCNEGCKQECNEGWGEG